MFFKITLIFSNIPHMLGLLLRIQKKSSSLFGSAVSYMLKMAQGSFQHFISFTLLLLCSKPGLGSGCVEKERQALLDFKQGLVDDFGILSSWGNEEDRRDCCKWRGVQCSNRTSHVIMLDLHALPTDTVHKYQSLRGRISSSLLELQHLNHLDLSLNDFQGSYVPEFIGLFSKLRYLNLSEARLAGMIPSHLGNLSNLHFLDLSRNYGMSSETLEWLSRLSSLRHLDLSGLNLDKAIYWEHVINRLPSLTDLLLHDSALPQIITPSALSYTNSSKSLVVLDLSWNFLSSSVYPWLFNLSSSLVHLDLSVNQIQGLIPDTFGGMVSLEYLDLFFNQLEGEIPQSLTSTSLVHLDLSVNHLHGSIPDTFGHMTSLSYLDLSLNQLEGGIPKSFKNLCSLQMVMLLSNSLTAQLPEFVQNSLSCSKDTLEVLVLSWNQFTGSFPDFTGFSALGHLYIDHNRLNGTFPEYIGQLSQLELLEISVNSLHGNITEAHLSSLSKLYWLDLSSNSLALELSPEWTPPFQVGYLGLLSCKMGPNFPGWLQTQKDLFSLDISNSSISDVIPSWFWNLTSKLIKLRIANNQIRGRVPSLRMETAAVIDLSLNRFEGPIPSLPSGVRVLSLSKNLFSGSISLLCTIVDGALSYLDLSDNLLSGALPDCWQQWRDQLQILNLANNNFSGKLPYSLGSLVALQTLHLYNNGFLGELPSSLMNCTKLRLVDMGKNRFSGEIPTWIGERLSDLVVLSLRSNEFHGSISSDICLLKELQILDFSRNNISGTIPRCLNNFTAMAQKMIYSVIAHDYLALSIVPRGRNKLGITPRWAYSSGSFDTIARYVDSALIPWKGGEFEYKNILGLVRSIDLSSNKLSGEIPKEITKLMELISLNLSRNHLNGQIPSMIGQLKSLDVLDLSKNQLDGKIPSSLSQIDRLSVLDLSSNNLSGQIPSGTQLQGFEASSYMGNPELCGSPLKTKCQEDETAQTSPTSDGNEDDLQDDEFDPWFYVSIALGFLVGFWGVWGTLVLKSSWSEAYFRFLNKIKDWFF